MKLHKIFEITQSRPFPEFNFMQKYLEGFQYEVSVNEIDYGFPDIWISHNYDENGLLYPDYLFLAIGINFDANFRLPRSNKSYQVTGESIPLERRFGLLDRKLRVVSENVHESGECLKAAQSAFKSIYGYEWQGDNLFLAREALLYTFIDYYLAKFGKEPQLKSLLYIVYIISWNIWQMDGLKGVIPDSCGERRTVGADLFGETEVVSQCEGCKTGDIRRHNGTYALIKDWGVKKDKQKIRFIDLMK